MTRNYIFDFGNVLGRFSPEDMTAACVPESDTARIVCQVAFDRLYWDRLDAGTMTDDEVRQAFRSRLSGELYDLACLVYDRWIELLPPIAGMQELAADIKRSGGKLFLLSNISIGFAQGYYRNPWIKALFDIFDGLVFSSTIGHVKPDPVIFRHLLDRYNLEPEECIFIDDRADNIAGGEAMGIKGYLFDGDAQKLRRTLGI